MTTHDPHFHLKQERREKALASVRNALVLEDLDVWADQPMILSRYLREEELAMLAHSCLRALPQEVAGEIASRALDSGAVGQWPTDREVIAEADHWATWASPRQLGAYTMAAIKRMAPRSRFKLKEWVNANL